jgi:hydroxyethylthiazole kinase-like sugar kinase family protein
MLMLSLVGMPQYTAEEIREREAEATFTVQRSIAAAVFLYLGELAANPAQLPAYKVSWANWLAAPMLVDAVHKML